ncbi:histone-lysine N-methyltransferase CLF isoform X2 [Ziziphus jujuba]|uniref:Histone-lysine N-methyltransferase CLF isoform X2 n=1 Tax=Ziziphus jujuba TaxID=326968 RepID=A0A6P4A6M7_ZIZJJ|nr:histone-lysine N-methyltransferase CLF isoform X2 [Ziziphus jujuba]
MASKASPSASASGSKSGEDLTMMGSQGTSPNLKEISSVIEFLKKQVASQRGVSIQKRMEENKQKLVGVTNYMYNLSMARRSTWINDTGKNVDLLIRRQKDAFDMHNGIDVNNGDKDTLDEDGHASTAVLLGSNVAVKNAVRPIKLTEVKRLPPYTTWIFLDRNQRMTEDQSVVGRRRIYYDQNGGEALICSDSEEEAMEDEEEKRDFVESEDYVLCMTIKEVGFSDTVLETLAQCFSRSPCEVKARYEILNKEEKAVGDCKNGDNEDASQIGSSFLDKDLDAALDSFDNLFCRRCLVFDCRLHGCSQDLVFPAEKQPSWSPPDDENISCGLHCYRSVLKSERTVGVSSPSNGDFEEKNVTSCEGVQISLRKKPSGPSARKTVKSCQSESASSNAKNISESSDSENGHTQDDSHIHHPSPSKTKLAGKCGIRKRNSKRVAERVLACMQKRQKKMVASDSDSIVNGGVPSDTKLRSNSCKENEDSSSSSHKNVKSPIGGRSRRKESTVKDSHIQVEVPDGSSNEMITDPPATSSDDNIRKEEFVDENLCKQESGDDKSWKTIEKGLFEKGIEIFGRNSCLIARNLLSGLKTCWEVFQYMNHSQFKMSCQPGDASNSLMEGYSKGNNEARRRSRFLRRKGRVRRLKYTWKSAAYHSIRKRITERKDQPCRQYNPCNCQTACGKQCACLLNGTCCEKYCGCPKSCKNRFRGCHCAKSQCRSRQCPCFAADRECDPDVCRNCWVSCGDGTLGVPNQRGDNYECRNMKLLLKQQQRVLLGRSDISGWGAFLKNNVGKHEYLGEYTGELISHREADKRGKIYDRENSSFLFNLNDQFVLDAYRKGDKLKFANHSPDPNCYAKVIMVAGDHRVGIFAKERISAGEELFYDYRYEPDRAPAWARKPEASGSKKEDGGPSSGRAKKLA